MLPDVRALLKCWKFTVCCSFLFLSLLIAMSINSARAEAPSHSIKVGIFNNKPVVFQDDQGRPQGIYVALLNEIARKNNWQIEYHFDSWSNNLESLKKGEIDIMTSIAFVKERDPFFEFSQESFLSMWGQVYVRNESAVQGMGDLQGKKVAILKNGVNGIRFRQLVDAFGIRCEVVEAESYTAAGELLLLGDVDACVTNNMRGYELEYDHNIKKTSIMFNPFKLLLATRKGTPTDILDTVDQQLRAWKENKNSIYYKTLQRWFGNKAPTREVLPEWVRPTLVIGYTILLISFVWSILLWRQVKKRKQVEESLLVSNKRFRMVLDSLNAMIYVSDLNTHELKFVNKFGRETLGDIEGAPCWKALQSGQDGPCDFCTNDRLVDADGQSTGIYRWEFQNTVTGQWFDCQEQAICWDDGQLVRVEIATDITESKKSKEKLLLSEGRLSEAQKIAKTGSWCLDVPTGELYWSDEIYRIFGRVPGEFEPSYERFYETVHPDDVIKVKSSEEKSFEKGEKHSIDHRIVLPDGTVRWVHEEAIAKRGPDGEVISLAGTVQDITEQKALEAENLRLSRLASLGEMASGVAHEINNPIAGVIGCTELLKMRLSHEKQHHELIDKILKESNRIVRIVMSLQEVSYQGRSEKSFSVADCVDTVLSLYGGQIEKAGIEIDCNVSDNLQSIYGDKQMFEQVILNLIQNSLYALNGSEQAEKNIVLSVREVNDRKVRFVEFSIKDNGPGMPDEIIDKVFDPFFTTKPVGSGTGLGLSLCHNIIKSFDGEIAVRSRTDEYTEVIIKIPGTK